MNEFCKLLWHIVASLKNLVHTYGTLFVQKSVVVLFGTCTGFVQIAVFAFFVSVCFCKLLCLFCMGFVRAMQGTVRGAGRGSNPPS